MKKFVFRLLGCGVYQAVVGDRTWNVVLNSTYVPEARQHTYWYSLSLNGQLVDRERRSFRAAKQRAFELESTNSRVG